MNKNICYLPSMYTSIQGGGMFAPYRINEEILISFIRNQPTEPIIIGSLTNTTNLYPFKNYNVTGLICLDKEQNYIEYKMDPNEGLMHTIFTKKFTMNDIDNNFNETIKSENKKITYDCHIKKGDYSITLNNGTLNLKANDMNIDCNNLKINVKKDFKIKSNNLNIISNSMIKLKSKIYITESSMGRCKFNIYNINAKILKSNNTILIINSKIINFFSKVTTYKGIQLFMGIVPIVGRIIKSLKAMSLGV